LWQKLKLNGARAVCGVESARGIAGTGIGADDLAYPAGRNQSGKAAADPGTGIVRYHGKVACALAQERIQKLVRLTDSPESPDKDRGAILDTIDRGSEVCDLLIDHP
jgi:hypothetical protein